MSGAEKQSKLLKLAILALISIVAIGSRLFSVIRFESIIHEFDPWFNYRTTKYLVTNGAYEFWNWFDEKAWYPLGRVVGGTLYPGIMITSGLIYKLLQLVHLSVDIREVCVFLAPVFSAATVVATYLWTTEVAGDSIAGLFAAAFMGVAPGYISRSVAGSYDNEGIAIFLLVFTFYLWTKAVKRGSMFYGALTALSYFYMVSAWGGYVFIINLIPLHVFVLLLIGHYSNGLYVAYCTFYVLGTLASMQIPFVGFQPTFTSEHMAALGTFGLIQLFAFTHFVNGLLSTKRAQRVVATSIIALGLLLGLAALLFLTVSGKIAPWAGRFYSLWDTGYARIHVPIIASVSEHQPTVWTMFFMDLNVLVWLFPAGIYFCFQSLTDHKIFLLIYAVFASYFAGVMVRLMLTLTPIVCVLSGIAMSEIFRTYLSINRNNISTFSRAFVVSSLIFLLAMFQLHSTWVTSNAYSSPSVVLASRDAQGNRVIIDDFREAYYWLRKNSHPDSKVMSWWDYGYQLAGFADRTTLVDNNTWNNTHIATVARILASDERSAHSIMSSLDIDYALVVYGGMLSYSGDDINKFIWMIRIGQNVYPDDLQEGLFYTPSGQYAIGDSATQKMKQSIMHKFTYFKLHDVMGPNGADRTRNQRLPSSVSLDYFEEVYSSENLLVRIYKPKPLDNLGRPLDQL